MTSREDNRRLAEAYAGRMTHYTSMHCNGRAARACGAAKGVRHRTPAPFAFAP